MAKLRARRRRCRGISAERRLSTAGISGASLPMGNSRAGELARRREPVERLIVSRRRMIVVQRRRRRWWCRCCRLPVVCVAVFANAVRVAIAIAIVVTSR